MRRAWFLGLVLTTTACPWSDDDSGDGSGYVALDDLASAYKQAYCTYLVRCGEFPDQSTCVDTSFGTGFFIDENVMGAMRAGTIRYNGNAISRCFAALAARECDRTSQSYRVVPLDCSKYFAGTLASGESCLLDQQCISQQCSGERVEDACTAGTCVGDTAPSTDRLPIGAPCASFDACQTGAFCSTITGMCTKLLAQGELCNDSEECAYGTACSGASGARTCRALPTEGQPCPDFACRDEGLYCSSATQTCVKYALPPASCTTGDVQCSPYLPCDPTSGQCKRGPILGEQCSFSRPCSAVGTFCDTTTTFTCVATKPDGASCAGSEECQSNFCDFTLGTCKSQLTCF